MKSSACDSCSGSLYGAQSSYASTWCWWLGQTSRPQLWVDWPVYSSNSENFSPTLPCRSMPQLGRDCPNSSSYSMTCLPPSPYQPPSRLTRELFSAQRGGYHVHSCVPPCGSVCITMKRAQGSGMPQMEQLGCVNCEEFGGQKGPLQENYQSGCYWAVPQTVQKDQYCLWPQCGTSG